MTEDCPVKLDVFSFADNDEDFDFISTTKSSNEVGDNQHGGVPSSPNTGNALQRGNSSSTLTGPLLQLLALSLFVALKATG